LLEDVLEGGIDVRNSDQPRSAFEVTPPVVHHRTQRVFSERVEQHEYGPAWNVTVSGVADKNLHGRSAATNMGGVATSQRSHLGVDLDADDTSDVSPGRCAHHAPEPATDVDHHIVSAEIEFSQELPELGVGDGKMDVRIDEIGRRSSPLLGANPQVPVLYERPSPAEAAEPPT
jgi:hypothetical protein